MNQKILTKRVISKISVDSNFKFTSYAFMIIHVHWHCSKTTVLNKVSSTRVQGTIAFISCTKMISAYFLLENVFLRGEL